LRPAVRTAVVILAGLVFATVGFSRVELGVHWTTDVVAAGLATMVWLAVITSVWHLCATRRSRTTTEQTGDAAVHRMSRRPPCTSALAGATRSSHLLTGALRVRTSLVKTMSYSNPAELWERIGVLVRGPLNLTK
jgi:hypothetical protein